MLKFILVFISQERGMKAICNLFAVRITHCVLNLKFIKYLETKKHNPPIFIHQNLDYFCPFLSTFFRAWKLSRQCNGDFDEKCAQKRHLKKIRNHGYHRREGCAKADTNRDLPTILVQNSVGKIRWVVFFGL